MIPGQAQNRSRSNGMAGHDQTESSVTFLRNSRSRWSGIRNLTWCCAAGQHRRAKWHTACDPSAPTEGWASHQRYSTLSIRRRNWHSSGQCLTLAFGSERRDIRRLAATDTNRINPTVPRATRAAQRCVNRRVQPLRASELNAWLGVCWFGRVLADRVTLR